MSRSHIRERHEEDPDEHLGAVQRREPYTFHSRFDQFILHTVCTDVHCALCSAYRIFSKYLHIIR